MDEQLKRPSRIGLALAAMVFAALAPVTAWLAWQVGEQVHAQRAQVAGELQRAASGFAQSVDRELASSVDALTVLSQSELFQQGRIAAMGRLLHGRPRRDWDSIFLLDPQGAVVLDTAQHPPPADSMRDVHSAALRKLAPVVSGAGKVTGITLAKPDMQRGQARCV